MVAVKRLRMSKSLFPVVVPEVERRAGRARPLTGGLIESMGERETQRI